MNLAEFKAWFDGYTEDMKDAPSKKQWERIKARVAEINGVPITQTVYIDRYVRPGIPYWGAVAYGAATGAAGLSNAGYNASNNLKSAGAVQTQAFDSIPAMYAAGKAEALAA